MNKQTTIEIDATGRAPGRIATEIAVILRGKNKPDFKPNVLCGDEVKVVNAKKMKFTGKKLEQKEYIRHSGYPGGLKRLPMKKVFEKDPTEVLRKAVWNMLPKNKLRNEIMKNLKIEE